MSRARRSSAWPDAEQRLLLRAALLDGEAAATAWREWREGGGDVERLEGPSHRLLPQLYRNLTAAGIEDPALPRLKGIYRHSWYTNQRRLRDGAGALGALEAAGIETMLLKGAALIAAFDRDRGVRPMEDVDVLVRPDAAARAAEALEAAQWRPKRDRPLREVKRIAHAADLLSPGEGKVDLHWNAFWEGGDDGPLWARSSAATLGGVPTRVPAACDQLLLACVHGVSWSPAPVRWVVDAALVVRTAGADIDWDALVAEAHSRGVAPDAAAALGHLRSELGLPIPERVSAELAAAPVGLADRVLQRVKHRPERRARFWFACFDHARRLARHPVPEGRPEGTLDYVREVWQLRTRRAVLARAVRSGLRPEAEETVR